MAADTTAENLAFLIKVGQVPPTTKAEPTEKDEAK